MSEENQQAVVERLNRMQSSIGWKAAGFLVVQTIAISSFLFGMRANIDANTRELDKRGVQIAQVEANQRDLIRITTIVERIARDLQESQMRSRELERLTRRLETMLETQESRFKANNQQPPQ